MRYILVTFFISALILPLMAQPEITAKKMPAPFKVIPQPKEVVLLKRAGLKCGELQNLQRQGDFKRPVMGEILSEITEVYRKNKGTLTLILEGKGGVSMSPEGYVLKISNGNAEIISRGEAGLFYGCQTLEQLLEDARDFQTAVPACVITDYPAMSYRAVHFDVKHHLDHMNYYYESIDRLARYKINAVIFEFEDKLRYRRQPLVGAPQAISIDEMAALTRYARERHIEISPLVQGLGHATFILKHEKYAHLRELADNRWAFCPMDTGTYKVLFDMYLDAIEATPGSGYLHVGGDEVGNIGLCPRCKPYAEKHGVIGLNAYWLKKVSEFILAHGRIPIFWDDMPLKAAGMYKTTHDGKIDARKAEEMWKQGEPKLLEVVRNIPEKCVFMRWNYSMGTQPGNIMALDWYGNHGLKAMIATAAQTSAVLFPHNESVAAIRSFVQLAAEKGIDGMLCTAWDDRSPHMETYWRGFIASAEYSWSPGRKSLDEYDEAYLQKEYGVQMPNYHALYSQLREAAVFWEKAYNRKGGRMDMGNALLNLPGLAHWMPPKEQKELEKTDFTERLIDLPDLKNPGEWTVKYKKRLEEAASLMKEYRHTSVLLDSLHQCSAWNRYHWELFSAIDDFQITAPRMLLALQECDTGDKARRQAGKEKVYQALTAFDRAWNNLQAVYGKTRFLAYPPEYVPDRYYHSASQREDLTWMIQVEELFQAMLNRWMEKNKLK